MTTKWIKKTDRWAYPFASGKGHYQVMWKGQHWVASTKEYGKNAIGIRWPTVLGKFSTSTEAKKACEEHSNAVEEGFKPENYQQEHQNRNV